jgi:hypothetical protein
MALRPEDRYPSALALAADVEHWLADEPVRAWHEPLLPRVTRWARRHRTLVAGLAALLLTAVAALSISTVLIGREQVLTELARQQAVENARVAQQQRQRAEDSAAEARRQRKTAEAQRLRAEANYRKARSAVDQMLTQVGQERLANIPQMEVVRQTLLQEALHFYREFLRENQNDPKLRLETGRAEQRVGDIERLLGHQNEAETEYAQAVTLLEQLVGEFPAVPAYRQELGNVYNNLGRLLNNSPPEQRRKTGLP